MNDQETRKQNRLEKLGVDEPSCIICQETDWRCLEEHHIAGRAYHDDTVIMCRNCHRKVSDVQKDHPPKTKGSLTEHEKIGRFLLGLADFFTLLTIRLREFGEYLIETNNETKNNDR